MLFRSSCNRLNKRIEQILDFSRIAFSVVHPTECLIDMVKVTRALCDEARPYAVAAGTELVFEDTVDGPVAVKVDVELLEKAVLNLLSNAFRDVSSRGTVTMRVTTRDGWAFLQVSDTGAGIDPDDLPHVFDRFYRSPKSPGEGSGLGLSIVQGIIKAHGGRIWVESKKGAGACFVIRLPRSEDQAKAG